MVLKLVNFFTSARRASVAWFWASCADELRRDGQLPNKTIRAEARKLHRDLSLILQLTGLQAKRARGGLGAFPVRPGTDWRWRPAIFSGQISPKGVVQPKAGARLGHEVAVWHDCSERALTLRQVRNSRADDLAPYGLQLDVMGFSGEYLSLSIDLPEACREELERHHVLRLQVELGSELPINMYGRLNLVQGPNTAQVVQGLDDSTGAERSSCMAEFDLYHAGLADRPVEKAWVDLIFGSPYMNGIFLSDVVMSRYPRAEV